MKRLRVLTWHVHGNYLYYLSLTGHTFYLPVRPGRPEGYGGRCGDLPWPENVIEVPAEEVRRLELDCVLYQSRRNYLHDRLEVLGPGQRRLPAIYLEHDPPREHPTDTRHVVDDPEVLLVHVTPFNALMWDSGRTPIVVIEHGVPEPVGVRNTGELARGLVVVNHLASRGRRLGLDIYQQVRATVPLELVGMGSEELGGLGEVPQRRLPALAARYRFFFSPVRYTSLPLAVCEAMMLGMPVVAVATTEMATVLQNGVSGFADTRVERLVEAMRLLLDDPAEARRLGEGARQVAQERFHICRFIADWDHAFAMVAGGSPGPPAGRALRGASLPGGR